MGNVVSTTNVYSQLGQESTPGSGTTTTTKLRSMSIAPGRELTIREIMAAGHRFDTGSVVDKQWASFDVTEDAMTYTEHVYCLENIFGHVSASTLGSLTYKRVYAPALTGSITPKTWIQQWGDPNDNVNDYAYGLLTDYGETWDREAGVKQNGSKGIAQIIATGSAFTASPQQLAEQAISAQDFNVYLDTTGAALGTTQITDEIAAVDWSITGMKAARWAANRSYASFAGHVDMKPKATAKFTIYEGSVARPIVASLVAGGKYFLRLDGTSSVLVENDFVVSLGSPSAGNFTLTYKSQTTANIAYNAAASAVASALQALSTIGATGCTVSGSAGGPYTVTMTGALINDSTDQLTGSGSGLTGGTFGVVANQYPYQARRDMALLLTQIAPLKDNKGVYGQELSFAIIEDATWNNALQITSQTGVSTL